MVAATVDGLRVVSLYAPNGRIVDSPFYAGKLAWFERLGALDPRDDRARRLARPGRRPQRRADRRRRVGRRGGPRRHARLRARASRLPGAARPGSGRRLPRSATTSPAASRGGTTAPGCSTRTSGMRIDHLLVSPPVAARIVDAEIDREARKGPPIPSDHAPLLIDLDEPGRPINPDWEGALATDQGENEAAAPLNRGSWRPIVLEKAASEQRSERTPRCLGEQRRRQRTPAPTGATPMWPPQPVRRARLGGSSPGFRPGSGRGGSSRTNRRSRLRRRDRAGRTRRTRSRPAPRSGGPGGTG